MEFVNRENELQLLHKLAQRAQSKAQFVVITGRRRIGKTRLIREAFADKMVYWFVSRKAENLLAKEFENQLRSFFNLPKLTEAVSLARVFELAFILSKDKSFTLVIDEFQNFKYVNPSFFSELQRLWDIYKDSSKINLVVAGSVISIMKHIFQSSSEPLFGRANRILKLTAFNVEVLKSLLLKYNSNISNWDLLLFYVLTGGVPKYVEILVDEEAFSFEEIVNLVFDRYSPFIEEGKNLLVEEFGQDYSIYFSILDLIARGYNKRVEIENVLSKSVSGYLQRLKEYFELIDVIKPIFDTKKRLVRYYLSDNFLSFWFYFFYRNWSLVEIENWTALKEIFYRSYKPFAGKMLEKYFKEKLALSENYTKIGSWWDRKGENEIDIVAVDELNKKIDVFEVMIDKKKIDLRRLYSKAENLRKILPDYKFEYKGLSLEDM